MPIHNASNRGDQNAIQYRRTKSNLDINPDILLPKTGYSKSNALPMKYGYRVTLSQESLSKPPKKEVEFSQMIVRPERRDDGAVKA